MRVIFIVLKILAIIYLSYTIINFKIKKENIYKFVSIGINKIKKIKINNKKSLNIIKKIEYFNRLNLGKHINIKLLLILMVILSVVLSIIFIINTKIILFSIILSIFIASIPIQYISFKNNLFKRSFNQNLNLLIINLKNNVKNNNDIVFAIKKTVKNSTLKVYFQDFIYAINNGVNVIEAFDYIKDYFNINEFTNLISIFQNCYVYGGNYYNILKNAEEQIKEKKKLYNKFYKANTEIISTLIIMLFINIYIVFSFILSNKEYINLYLNTIIGKVIIDINLIIIIKIYFTILNSGKVEDLNET